MGTNTKKIVQDLKELLVEKKIKEEDLQNFSLTKKATRKYQPLFDYRTGHLVFCRHGKRLIILIVNANEVEIRVLRCIDEIGPYWFKKKQAPETAALDIAKLIESPENSTLKECGFEYVRKFSNEFAEKNIIFYEMLGDAYPEYRIFPKSLGHPYIHHRLQIGFDHKEWSEQSLGEIVVYLFSRIYYLYGRRPLISNGNFGHLRITLDSAKTKGINGQVEIRLERDLREKRVYTIIFDYQGLDKKLVYPKTFLEIGYRQIDSPDQLEKYFLIISDGAAVSLDDPEIYLFQNRLPESFNQLFYAEIMSIRSFFLPESYQK